MALIIYMLSSFIGLFAAIVGYVFFGLNLADAFLVYSAGSIALGTLIVSGSLMLGETPHSSAHDHRNRQTTS